MALANKRTRAPHQPSRSRDLSAALSLAPSTECSCGRHSHLQKIDGLEHIPPLHRAAIFGDLTMLDEALLAEDRDHIDKLDNRSMTALMLASEKNYPEIVEMLVQAKADLNLQDEVHSYTLVLQSHFVTSLAG